MISPFAILFVAIQNRIKAITINSQQAFPWIDQDLMQIESHDGNDRPPVLFPAITIDIDDAEFTSLGRNTQKGNLKVCIRIAFAPFSSSSTITPASWRNKAISYYDLENAVHASLQGWTPGTVTVDDTTMPVTTADLSDIFGSFVRVRASTERRNDRIRVRQLIYMIPLDDYSTEKTYTLQNVTLNLTDEIQIPV